MSRPPKDGTRISVKLSRDALSRLDKFAAENDLNRTAAIESIISEYTQNKLSSMMIHKYKEILKAEQLFDAGPWAVVITPGGTFIRDKRNKSTSKKMLRLTLDIDKGYYYISQGTNRIYIDFEKRLSFELVTVTDINGNKRSKRRYQERLPEF